MPEQRLIDSQWVDILPPPPPEPVALWVWAMVLLVCACGAAIAWWIWQRQPRRRALRQLRSCERQLNHAMAPPKQVAAALYRAVQQAVATIPTAQLHARDAQWQDYYRRLAQCVFHAREPDVAQLREVLHETRAWLRLK